MWFMSAEFKYHDEDIQLSPEAETPTETEDETLHARSAEILTETEDETLHARSPEIVTENRRRIFTCQKRRNTQ